MVTSNRTIGRQTTNGQPAWRSAMTVGDRLYYVSASTIDSANAAFDWPNKGIGWSLANNFSTNTNYARDQCTNYCSGTILYDDLGPHGSMVFGTGGHTRVQTQLLRCRLSEDAPTWDWWQNAVYETSDTGNNDFYWNPTEAASFPANRTIALPEDYSGWDGTFPMGWNGWVFPRKIKTGQTAANTIHGYRFNCVAYVPPSLTGTGRGGLIATTHSPQGPFAQSWKPGSMPVASLLDGEAIQTVSGTNYRRNVMCLRDVGDGLWRRVPGYAPYVPLYGEYVSPTVVVSERTKRAYVLFAKAGGNYGYYYVNLASGITSATYSSFTELTYASGAGNPTEYAMSAFTDGFSRDLLYAVRNADKSKLVVMDLDNGIEYPLAINNTIDLMTPNGTLMYDSLRHRLLHVRWDSAAGTYRLWKITIPDDITNASAYGVTSSLLSVDASIGSLATPIETDRFGRISFHKRLGCVLIATRDARMMGFVPA